MADIPASRTDIQISTDSAFGTIVLNDSGAYRTVRPFAKGDLPYGVALFARTRHSHVYTGDTPWSASLQFKIIVPANIIGVCLDNSGTKGVFYWIDALGNKVASFDWTTHPIFKNIAMTTMDDARSPVTMTKLPLFFVKTASSGPVGTFSDGKKCWWISDLADFGFRPAACFKRSVTSDVNGKFVISPYCYIGTYMGHSETIGGATCIGSKKSQTVVTGQSKTTYRTWISNRNNVAAGVSGFRMFDIWDMSALRLLLLIATANSDTQTKWGDNAATATPATGSTNARAVFKGTQADPQISIDDLWKCFFSYVDLISTTNGVSSLTSPMDLTSAISFGEIPVARYTQPTTGGWLRDVLDCPMTIGNDVHDLLELFLPKSTVTTEDQATFSDTFTQNDAAGELFCGFPFNYLETYQNYEQTGTTTETYQTYEQTGTRKISEYEYYRTVHGTSCYYEGDGGCSKLGSGSACRGDSCPFPGGSAPVYGYVTHTRSVPVYGYVTRTRPKAYTTEPGLFALAKGIPFAAYNAAAYGCRICKN